MTQWLFPPRPIPSLPIVGDDRRLPVRRILCVGQNYAAHAREMGSDPDKQTPFFFTKPGDAIVSDGANPSYPSATANLHYEAELVAAIGPGEDGGVAIVGWAVGCDLTRRDLQAEAKQADAEAGEATSYSSEAPAEDEGSLASDEALQAHLFRRIDEIAHLFRRLGVVHRARNLLDYQDRKGGAQARAHNLVPLQIAAHSASSHPVSR